MAIKTPRSFTSSFFLLFLLLSSKLVSANKNQALLTSSSNFFAPKNGLQPKVSTRDGSWKLVERSNGAARRMMIGSIAPHCTYECRGCRFKCSAEQVPVDANDPMNSAYRYRCVCHR